MSIRKFLSLLISVIFLASCATYIKPVNYSKYSQTGPTTSSESDADNDPKFLDNISSNAEYPADHETLSKDKMAVAKPVVLVKPVENKTTLEKASTLQLKYAVLLNTDVEDLENDKLIAYVDEWYGTRYLMGGMSKSGIDCSAFTQTIYQNAFAVSIPRTAREQYNAAKIISATDLQEGDLVFFNTTGGVSHVGLYLINNKFAHASSSKGVTISDLFEPYYLRRYIGAGRIEKSGAKN